MLRGATLTALAISMSLMVNLQANFCQTYLIVNLSDDTTPSNNWLQERLPAILKSEGKESPKTSEAPLETIEESSIVILGDDVRFSPTKEGELFNRDTAENWNSMKFNDSSEEE